MQGMLVKCMSSACGTYECVVCVCVWSKIGMDVLCVMPI